MALNYINIWNSVVEEKVCELTYIETTNDSLYFVNRQYWPVV